MVPFHGCPFKNILMGLIIVSLYAMNFFVSKDLLLPLIFSARVRIMLRQPNFCHCITRIRIEGWRTFNGIHPNGKSSAVSRKTVLPREKKLAELKSFGLDPEAGC